MDTFLLLGIIGMALILIAFLLNQFSIWQQKTFAYDLCNAIGGLLLVLYAYDGKAWPFVVLNGVWTMYSAKDVLMYAVKHK